MATADPIKLVSRVLPVAAMTDVLYVDFPPDRRGAFPGRHFTFWENAGSAERGAAPSKGDEQSWVIRIPKGKARLEYVLDLAAAALPVGGRCYLVGEKRAGIKSAKKYLQARFDNVATHAAGNHSQLLVGTQVSQIGSIELAFERWDTGLGFDAFSLPGTFAQGRLDEGTALLIEALRELSAAGLAPCRALDLACGSGVIGAAILKIFTNGNSLELVASDADYLAVLAAEKTFEALGVGGRATVLASDGFGKVDGRFDLVVCNPPFHQGVDTSQIGQRFVEDAPAHMSRDASMVVVANRFLAYEKVLDATFDEINVLKETGRFKVLQARFPKT